MARAVPLGQVRAADEERGRERVRRRAVAGDDGRAEHACGGTAGPGIDHVPVPPAVDLEELLSRAARADGAVADQQAADQSARKARTQIDRPAAPAAADGDDAAPAGGEKRTAYAVGAQRRRHLIERVALADRAEVQLDAAPRE